jgi:hypothetical protein
MNELLALPWSGEPFGRAVLEEPRLDAETLVRVVGGTIGEALSRAVLDPSVGPIVRDCHLPRIYRQKFDELRTALPITQEALTWWFQPASLIDQDFAVLIPDDDTQGQSIGLFRTVHHRDVSFLLPIMISFSGGWEDPFSIKLHAGRCGLDTSEAPTCAGTCAGDWVCGPRRTRVDRNGPIVEGCGCLHPGDA